MSVDIIDTYIIKKISILLICIISINNSFGQDKMIINKPFNGNTYYDGFSTKIDSLSKLPSLIRYNLQGYLIVPKYDLYFVLRDKSIGIRCYYLQVRLDNYGQILY